MPLLHLPPEIFGRIVHFFVLSVSAKQAVKCRHVSKTFDKYIVEEICERASQIPLDQAKKTRETKAIFDIYGSAIVCKRAMRLGTPDDIVIEFIHRFVAYLPQVRWSTNLEPEKRREHDTILVCDMMMIETSPLRNYLTGATSPLGYLRNIGDCPMGAMVPAFAAASGEVDLLSQSVNTYEDIVLAARFRVFPGALNAAVAFDRTTVVNAILEYLHANVKGKRECGSWVEMRKAANAIVEALLLAVRLHKTQIARTLLTFLSRNRLFGNSTRNEFPENLIRYCIIYDNTELFYPVLGYKATGFYDVEQSEFCEAQDVSGATVADVLHWGHKRLLTMLVKHGHILLNQFRTPSEHETPLWFALRHRRYDIATILLDFGVDINAAVKKGERRTALWHSADSGDTETVLFLLRNGADPDHPNVYIKSPLWAATRNGHGESKFLIDSARRKGSGYVQRTDILELYKAEKGKEVENWGVLWG